MIIKIVRHATSFTTVSNVPFEDATLSFKAKGVLGYLLTRKENWVVQVSDLINRSTDGRDSVYAALKELRARGYARLETVRIKGRITAKRWVIFESLLDTGLPYQAEPYQGKPHLSNILSSSNGLKTHRGGKDSLRSSPVPSTNGFFETGTEEDPFIAKAITKLENHVRQERKMAGKRINRKLWYSQMRLLLQDIEGDRPRLKQVLMSYIKAPPDKFKPMADSASSFRSKFLQIENWVNKNAPPPPAERIQVEITSHRTV